MNEHQRLGRGAIVILLLIAAIVGGAALTDDADDEQVALRTTPKRTARKRETGHEAPPSSEVTAAPSTTVVGISLHPAAPSPNRPSPRRSGTQGPPLLTPEFPNSSSPGRRPRSPSVPTDTANPAPSSPAPGPASPVPPGPTPGADPGTDPGTDPDTEPEPADVTGCANLGRAHIGGVAEGETNDQVRAANARFRAAAPAIHAAEPSGHLVCGKPLTRWRDLVVQELLVGDDTAGRLLSGLSPTAPVIRVTNLEWMAWDWRASGDHSQYNFTGVPTGIERVNGFRVIRTSSGGVVTIREDSPSVQVLAGAWDLWVRDGDRMGAPATIPWGSAEKRIPARQGFDNGLIELPGATHPAEVFAAPADRFLWRTHAEAMTQPPPEPNSVMSVEYRSYYIGHDGRRHWIKNGGDWNCAKYQLGASMRDEVEIAVLASVPLGEQFVCPAKP